MKALCYVGKNKLQVERVKDPEILLPKDIILKVSLSSVCGSDLHYLNGFIPTMREGDILGHEFTGEVVEIGSGVKKLKVGDRVVVAPNVGCGSCYHCEQDEWSLCDNSNPTGIVTEKLTGYATGAFLGCSQAFGGYSGSHAEYIRVPYADHGCFKLPDSLSYEQGLFSSDALSTGYMAADMAVKSGDVVAVWGAGAVGQMAAASAWLKGASRVLIIDKYNYRLNMAARYTKAEVLNYEEIDILDTLKELTGGRGPDVCIDCVGMESNSTGFEHLYDRVKQRSFLESDRPSTLRQAIMACRKAGTLSIIGVYSGFADKFPIGPLVVKGLTVKSGMVHAQKYIPTLLQHIEKNEIDPTYLQTHSWSLEQGHDGYKFFGENRNECLRGVFKL